MQFTCDIDEESNNIVTDEILYVTLVSHSSSLGENTIVIAPDIYMYADIKYEMKGRCNIVRDDASGVSPKNQIWQTLCERSEREKFVFPHSLHFTGQT